MNELVCLQMVGKNWFVSMFMSNFHVRGCLCSFTNTRTNRSFFLSQSRTMPEYRVFFQLRACS